MFGLLLDLWGLKLVFGGTQAQGLHAVFVGVVRAWG